MNVFLRATVVLRSSVESTVTSTDTAFPVGFSRCLWQELFHPPTLWPHPRKETAWRSGAACGQVNCFSPSTSPARDQSRSAEHTVNTQFLCFLQFVFTCTEILPSSFPVIFWRSFLTISENAGKLKIPSNKVIS